MKLEKTPLDDVYILNKVVRNDDRGQFCRIYGIDELEKEGLKSKAVHINTSTSKNAGTLRGIHFQYPPYAECKIISCISGSIWDVAVDLRPKSDTKFQWFGTVLNPDNGKSLIVPEGFGHGFITLEKNSSVIYVVSEIYSPENECGARYDDPLLNIKWPITPLFLSNKDKSWNLIEKNQESFLKPFLEL